MNSTVVGRVGKRAGRGTHEGRCGSPFGVFEDTIQKAHVTTVRKKGVEDGFWVRAGWGTESVGLWC